LEEEPSFWGLLETPLMLSVVILAYQNAPVEFSREGTLDQRRRRLFDNFVDAMCRRRPAEARYTRKQTLHWLSWLASTMTRSNQSLFYLEDLHGDWLPTRTQEWLSRAGIVVASGLICGLFGLIGGLIGWISGLSVELGIGLGESLTDWLGAGLGAGLGLGLVVGLIGALIASFMELRPVETMRFGLADIPSRMRRATRSGLTVGLIYGLIVGLGRVIGGVLGLMYLPSDHLGVALLFGLLNGLTIGLFAGLTAGLLAAMAGDAVETRTRPNEGTRRSMRMSLGAVLVLVLTLGLTLGLMVGLSGRPLGELMAILGLSGGLIFGGVFSMRHFVLRLMLWMNRSAPLNYVHFLDYAATRLFLRKVGGGYIFVHRMLMDYFASLHRTRKT
jgi:hypothetical protein